MRNFFVVVSLLLFLNTSFAQTTFTAKDSLLIVPVDSTKVDKKWDVAVDIASRYIWRGQSWGGNYPVLQPSFNYAITNKLRVGIWATTNFQNDFLENDGTTPKSYHEFDVGLSYQLTNFLTLEVWDYYWPALQRMENVDTNYFNYGPNGVKTIDASLAFDFSEGYKLAFTGTISTLVGGNDYRYNADDSSFTRNYTTYIEMGYHFPDIFALSSSKFLQKIDAHPMIGAVINNQAQYYTYADYNKPSVINIALSLTREFQTNQNTTIPVVLSYTHNAATANTEVYGKNFLLAGISFWY